MSQGISLPSWAVIWEELHWWEPQWPWQVIGRSKSLISSLRTHLKRSNPIHLTSHVSHDQIWLRSFPWAHPYQVGWWSETNLTRESVNRLSRSKSLINPWSTHLACYVSFKWTRSMSHPKVHSYQVGQWSDKNCTRNSGKNIVSMDRQTYRKTDGQTDGQSDSSLPPTHCISNSTNSAFFYWYIRNKTNHVALFKALY